MGNRTIDVEEAKRRFVRETGQPIRRGAHMFEYLKKFEKLIVSALILMMSLVLLLITLGLGKTIVNALLSPPDYWIEINEMLEIFGLFLLILVGIELLNTLEGYFKEHVIQVEVVLVVALIAVSRKVIILDVLDIKDIPGSTLVGIGAIIISLSAGYYLVRRAHCFEEGGR